MFLVNLTSVLFSTFLSTFFTADPLIIICEAVFEERLSIFMIEVGSLGGLLGRNFA